MNNKSMAVLAWLCVILIAALFAIPVCAQTAVKEKAPMYSYVGYWNIPRAQWSEMDKSIAGDQKILEQAMANGTLVGFGNDRNVVHQADGYTHDDWWSSMSLSGLLNVLDQFQRSGSSVSPVLSTSTKHMDSIFVSRYYNWRPGSAKDAYTYVAYYRFKPDAPSDTLDTLSKNLFVPLLEKLIADGTILEYEIDTEAIHSEAPGAFWIVYISPTAEGLDKAAAARAEALRANPLGNPAFGNLVDIVPHRDFLSRTNMTYK
ncbi:MAG: hypothetical protein C5B55_10300 [Blastocatellia bacterium]|nr:MAG: hypothetical protein C5B55_10300 [Blastocatellia bacterium]